MMASLPSHLYGRSCTGNTAQRQFEDGCVSSLSFLKRLKLLEAIECHEGKSFQPPNSNTVTM